MAKTAKAKKAEELSNVIELDAVEELPLEAQIDKTLKKHNVTEALIAGLKDKYGGLKLRSVDNKEDFLSIKEARNDVRKYGILCEKICKAGRQSAIEIQKLWLSKEKEVLAKIDEVQNPLDAEIKKYEDEQARLELEEVRKRENAFAARQSELIKMGAGYMDGFYSLNHVSFEADTIKNTDQETYENSILSKYKVQYERNEAARIEEERKQKEAAESLRIAQEAMAAKEKEMQEREAALKKAEDDRLAAIRQQQEESDRARRQAEWAAEQEAERQKRERIDKRVDQLRELGLVYQRERQWHEYGDVVISPDVEIKKLSDAEWDALIEKTIPEIERCKKEFEEKRLAEVEANNNKIAQEAAQRERDRIVLEQKQAEEKRQLEIQRQKEDAEKATDKTKWQAYVAYHAAGVVPEMKSPSFKAKIAEAQKLIQKIINL